MEARETSAEGMVRHLPRGKPVLIELATVSTPEVYYSGPRSVEYCAPPRHLTFTMFSFYFGITKQKITKAITAHDVFAQGIYYQDLGRNIYEISAYPFDHWIGRSKIYLHPKLGEKELHRVRVSASLTEQGTVNIYTDIDNIAHVMRQNDDLADVMSAFARFKLPLPEQIAEEAKKKSAEIVSSLSKELISLKEGQKISTAAQNLLIMAQRIDAGRFVAEMEPHPGIRIDPKKMLEALARDSEAKQEKALKVK